MDYSRYSDILKVKERDFEEAWGAIAKKWNYQPDETAENQPGIQYFLKNYQSLIKTLEDEDLEVFLKGLRREGGFLADTGTSLEDLLTGTAIFAQIISDFIFEEYKDSPEKLYQDFQEVFYLRSRIFLECALGHELAKEAVIKDQRVELEHLVVTDPLTGLYNHSYLYHRIKDEILRSERYTHKLAILLADIDDFKEYNDVHGHIKGDEVIRKIASILFEESRASDTVGRYGGEEFVVLLPENGGEEAYQFASRINKSVDQTKFEGMETQPKGKISLSIGYAIYPEDAKTVDDLLQKADIATDKAKAQKEEKISGP